jgi:excisionase family DNA binding protein
MKIDNVVLIPVPLEELLDELTKRIDLKLGNNQVQLVTQSKEYLTRSQVAKKLNVTLFTINEWTKKGKITGYRVGRRVLYKEHELDKALIPMKTKKT